MTLSFFLVGLAIALGGYLDGIKLPNVSNPKNQILLQCRDECVVSSDFSQFANQSTLNGYLTEGPKIEANKPAFEGTQSLDTHMASGKRRLVDTHPATAIVVSSGTITYVDSKGQNISGSSESSRPIVPAYSAGTNLRDNSNIYSMPDPEWSPDFSEAGSTKEFEDLDNIKGSKNETLHKAADGQGNATDNRIKDETRPHFEEPHGSPLAPHADDPPPIVSYDNTGANLRSNRFIMALRIALTAWTL